MRKYLFLFVIILFSFSYVAAQPVFNCVVDGDEFNGVFKDAVVIKLGQEEYVQIHVADGEEVIYLYLKESLLKGNVPIELEYKEHNYETGHTPDAELVWVPDGPDNPQWNTIEGKAIVTNLDEAAKTISGSFEFVVERFTYSSNKNKKRPSAEVEKGSFSNIQYRIAESN